jgi:tRNA threonylcarbamoyl adenosine modification protein YjeE
VTDRDTAAATNTVVVDQPALESWGRAVGEAVAGGAIDPPLTVLLRGPLGAGKSVLARAIARGAGVTGPMPSPTYNLLFSYEGAAGRDEGAGEAGEPLVVNHLDLYRLEHPDDVWELGWQELGEGRQIVLIEWPERAEALLPPDRWEARLSFLDDDGDAALRRLELRRLGSAPGVPSLPGDAGSGGAGSGSAAGPGDAS